MGRVLLKQYSHKLTIYRLERNLLEPVVLLPLDQHGSLCTSLSPAS